MCGLTPAGARSWRRSGVGLAGVRPPKGRYGLRRTVQRKRGIGVVLTVHGIGRGGGIVVPAGRSLGGVQSELEEKTLQRSVQRGSGPDDPMGRSTPVLRGCGGGEGCSRNASVLESHGGQEAYRSWVSKEFLFVQGTQRQEKGP